MPLPVSASRRKGSDTLSSDKNKQVVRQDEPKNEGQGRNETYEASNNLKKSELPLSTNAHRKSDAEKTLQTDTMEKLAPKGIDLKKPSLLCQLRSPIEMPEIVLFVLLKWFYFSFG